MIDEVKQILVTFARFEENGTLPNTIHGENASNRDTSDAPLWYGIVCEEMAKAGQTASPADSARSQGRSGLRPSRTPDLLYGTVVVPRGRTIADVLAEIAL